MRYRDRCNQRCLTCQAPDEDARHVTAIFDGYVPDILQSAWHILQAIFK